MAPTSPLGQSQTFCLTGRAARVNRTRPLQHTRDGSTVLTAHAQHAVSGRGAGGAGGARDAQVLVVAHHRLVGAAGAVDADEDARVAPLHQIEALLTHCGNTGTKWVE